MRGSKLKEGVDLVGDGSVEVIDDEGFADVGVGTQFQCAGNLVVFVARGHEDDGEMAGFFVDTEVLDESEGFHVEQDGVEQEQVGCVVLDARHGLRLVAGSLQLKGVAGEQGLEQVERHGDVFDDEDFHLVGLDTGFDVGVHCSLMVLLICRVVQIIDAKVRFPQKKFFTTQKKRKQTGVVYAKHRFCVLFYSFFCGSSVSSRT